MINRIAANLFTLAFAFSLSFPLPSFAHQSRPGSALCRHLLATPEQLSPANGPLAEAFFSSPQLFYNNGKLPPQSAFPFYASNEDDWHNTPWDDSPTDILVGFGTNSAWDLALRKNAKSLMIADHAAGPLIAQEYILAPLLRIAETPAEFLALLSGIDLPPERRNDDLEKLGPFVINYHDGRLLSEIAAEMQNVLRKLNASGTSADELRAIAEYYKALIKPDHHPNRFGVLRSHDAQTTGPLVEFYYSRYLPQLRRERGYADAVTHPEDSFLSSQASYSRFQKMFASRLYAHTDLYSADFYRSLKIHGDELGYRRYTFSVSNIFDANSETKAEAIRDFHRFRRLVDEIFPRDQYEVVIFLTTNDEPPHSFLRLERDDRVDEKRWLRSEPAAAGILGLFGFFSR